MRQPLPPIFSDCTNATHTRRSEWTADSASPSFCDNTAPSSDAAGAISLSDAISHLSRPPYVSHPSGHLYMDQARTSLGEIEHPIHGLIANATKQWNALLRKQSKTLDQAAAEYRARYNRRPPKGFDDWFRFAQANNVILIDEYDQIHRDVLPFLSLSPELLASRLRDVEADPFTHTFVVKNGRITIEGAKKDLPRASDQMNLMKDFVKWLPDMNITMSAHDGPSILLDYNLKEAHVKAAQAGKKIPDKVAETPDDDPA